MSPPIVTVNSNLIDPKLNHTCDLFEDSSGDDNFDVEIGTMPTVRTQQSYICFEKVEGAAGREAWVNSVIEKVRKVWKK